MASHSSVATHLLLTNQHSYCKSIAVVSCSGYRHWRKEILPCGPTKSRNIYKTRILFHTPAASHAQIMACDYSRTGWSAQVKLFPCNFYTFHTRLPIVINKQIFLCCSISPTDKTICLLQSNKKAPSYASVLPSVRFILSALIVDWIESTFVLLHCIELRPLCQRSHETHFYIQFRMPYVAVLPRAKCIYGCVLDALMLNYRESQPDCCPMMFQEITMPTRIFLVAKELNVNDVTLYRDENVICLKKPMTRCHGTWVD